MSRWLVYVAKQQILIGMGSSIGADPAILELRNLLKTQLSCQVLNGYIGLCTGSRLGRLLYLIICGCLPVNLKKALFPIKPVSLFHRVVNMKRVKL